jgi:hypothetical protein
MIPQIVNFRLISLNVHDWLISLNVHVLFLISLNVRLLLEINNKRLIENDVHPGVWYMFYQTNVLMTYLFPFEVQSCFGNFLKTFKGAVNDLYACTLMVITEMFMKFFSPRAITRSNIDQ